LAFSTGSGQFMPFTSSKVSLMTVRCVRRADRASRLPAPVRHD
jgi:hypothetical protein